MLKMEEKIWRGSYVDSLIMTSLTAINPAKSRLQRVSRIAVDVTTRGSTGKSFVRLRSNRGRLDGQILTGEVWSISIAIPTDEEINSFRQFVKQKVSPVGDASERLRWWVLLRLSSSWHPSPFTVLVATLTTYIAMVRPLPAMFAIVAPSVPTSFSSPTPMKPASLA